MKEAPEEGIEIAIKVIPNSSRSEVVGWQEGELRVRIAAVPEKGEANKALIKFLAKELGIAKSHIRLVSGQTNRHKRLFITGCKATPFQ